MNDVAGELISFIKSHPPQAEIEAKNLLFRFTTQNMFKCSFSIEPRCFEINHDSEYLAAFQKMFAPTLQHGLKWVFCLFFPGWMMDMLRPKYLRN